MWSSLDTATRISDAAYWALIVSLVVLVVAAVLLLWASGVRQSGWDKDRLASRDAITGLQAEVAEANARAADMGSAVAEANARAAAAAAEAMDANARAAEAGAALALARFNMPGMLSADQRARVAEKLRALPPAPYDLTAARGPEGAALRTQMEELLKAAKWVPVEVGKNGAGNGAGQSGSAAQQGSSGAGLDEVAIVIAESRRADWEPAVVALILALRAEGIHADGIATHDATPSAVHVRVGRDAGGDARDREPQREDAREAQGQEQHR